MRLTYSTSVQIRIQFNMRFSTPCIPMLYRGVLNSFVVPMLYPLNEKSPYTKHIQALKNLICDLGKISTQISNLAHLLSVTKYVTNNKKSHSLRVAKYLIFKCRGSRIRTCDLLLPKQAR